MIRALCLIALTAPLAAPALAFDKFVCQSELSTGFKFLNGHWSTVVFDVANQRFLVQEIPELKTLGQTYNAEVKIFGQQSRYLLCSRHRENGYLSPVIVCGGFVGGGTENGMIVNVGTLRFQDYYAGDYVEGGNTSKDDTPSLTIGTCSALSP